MPATCAPMCIVRHHDVCSRVAGGLAALASQGRIFATLNFARARLHATSAHVDSRAVNVALGATAPPFRSAAAPPPVLLCLALPGPHAGPVDHAGTTYAFFDEAQLLPCYLVHNSRVALALAESAARLACLRLHEQR